jgi:hypothetical protein
MGDEVVVDDDDSVRTSVLQNWLTATLSMEELFLSYQFISSLSTYQTGKNWRGEGNGRST